MKKLLLLLPLLVACASTPSSDRVLALPSGGVLLTYDSGTRTRHWQKDNCRITDQWDGPSLSWIATEVVCE